jgi:hypothetical protein
MRSSRDQAHSTILRHLLHDSKCPEGVWLALESGNPQEMHLGREMHHDQF